MRKYLVSLFSMILFFGSCGPNALSGLSSQTTDDYYFEEARKANNNQAYDYAIDVLVFKLSESAKTTVRAKELLASAYAGKCGFNFVDYTESLSNGLAGSAFRVVMTPFVGQSALPEFCLAALQTLDTLGTPQQRTANQNAFAAITGLVLMGTSLRAYSDVIPDNGDGNVDVNLCTGVTNDQMDDVIIGYGYFTTNFAFISASLVGASTFDALGDAVDMCNSVPGATCTVTDKDDITNDTRDIIRDLVNTVEYGIGSYVSNESVLQLPASCP